MIILRVVMGRAFSSTGATQTCPSVHIATALARMGDSCTFDLHGSSVGECSSFGVEGKTDRCADLEKGCSFDRTLPETHEWVDGSECDTIDIGVAGLEAQKWTPADGATKIDSGLL